MKILKICGKVLLIIVIIIAVILVIGLLFLEFYPSVGDTPDNESKKNMEQKPTCTMKSSSITNLTLKS